MAMPYKFPGIRYSDSSNKGTFFGTWIALPSNFQNAFTLGLPLTLIIIIITVDNFLFILSLSTFYFKV